MQIFIISWHGRHDNACVIAGEICKSSDRVAIVYSDPDPNFSLDAPCPAIRRSNNLYWEDKFKACLDATEDDGVLVIHADCDCDDWGLLLRKCDDARSRFINIGVWAPNIFGTYWNIGVSKLVRIDESSLYISAMTDGIVFYISPIIVERMRSVNYGENLYGWGIDGLFCAASHAAGLLVLIDSSIDVRHPMGAGYDTRQANTMLNKFLSQFSTPELIQYMVHTSYCRLNHEKSKSR